MFENVKKGNYYEATRQVTNVVSRYPSQEYPFWSVFIVLDSDSIHLEGKVNHILDVIGTIGGSFELIHYVIFLFYISLRNNLYFHTILKKINQFEYSQDDLNIKAYPKRRNILRTVNQGTNVMEKSKKFEDSKHAVVSTTLQDKIRSLKNDTIMQQFLSVSNSQTPLRK